MHYVKELVGDKEGGVRWNGQKKILSSRMFLLSLVIDPGDDLSHSFLFYLLFVCPSHAQHA